MAMGKSISNTNAYLRVLDEDADRPVRLRPSSLRRIASRVLVDEEYCWTEGETWGDNYLGGLETDAVALVMDGEPQEGGLATSYPLEPVRADDGKTIAEPRTYRIVGLVGDTAAARFREHAWKATLKMPTDAEPKPVVVSGQVDVHVSIPLRNTAASGKVRH